MKDVTDAAGERLLAALDEAVAAEQKCGSFGGAASRPGSDAGRGAAGRRGGYREGRRVFVTDANTAAKWADCTLDYSDD